MSQEYKCPWCKRMIRTLVCPDVQSFNLTFEVGTTSDVFGPSLIGYSIENMCTPCAWKLKKILEDLDVEIREIDV
jgi:glutaredoxin